MIGQLLLSESQSFTFLAETLAQAGGELNVGATA